MPLIRAAKSVVTYLRQIRANIYLSFTISRPSIRSICLTWLLQFACMYNYRTFPREQKITTAYREIWRNYGRREDNRRIEASRGLPLEEIYDRCATRGLIIGRVGTSRFNDLINSPVSGQAITGLCTIRLIDRTFYRQSFAAFPKLVAQRSGETSPTVTLISQIGKLTLPLRSSEHPRCEQLGEWEFRPRDDAARRGEFVS